jgi:hypothetical protein
MDYTSNEDVTLGTHGLIPAKKLKTPRVTELVQTKPLRSGMLKKVNN